MAHGGNPSQAGEQIEHLLEEVRAMVSPPAWERVDRLVRAIVELYGSGLERIVTMLAGDPHDAPLRRRLAADPLVAALLLLHGLHPDDLPTRVRQALERVRPYLGSHGGDVELLATDDQRGIVRLRMQGSCDGCPSSLITVKTAVEGAIRELAPEIVHIEVDGLADGRPARLPEHDRMDSAEPATVAAPSAWIDIDQLTELAPGRLAAAEIGGAHLVLCKLDERLYAYRNGCPSCGSTMDGGRLEGERLACPACGQRYDVRLAGRSLERRELHLDPVPLLEDGGHVKVALPLS